MILLSLVTSALAGPAFDEDANPQFGSAKVLRVAPSPKCVENPEAGIRWACPVELGGIPAVAMFMVDHHRWTGIMTVLQTDEEHGTRLVNELEDEWGPGVSDTPGRLSWSRGDLVMAVNVTPMGDDTYTVGVIMASVPELKRTGMLAP